MLEVTEKAHIHKILKAHDGNRTRAAKNLGISRKNLWEKMRHYDIQ